jgi:putative membrane protein
MSTSETLSHELAADEGSLLSLVVRGVIGGVLMGLANLVPGISGGTMLLAAGVYPGFISAIAQVTTLKFHFRSLVLLGTIAVSAALAILLLAGMMRSLVIDQRWVMYSLFIGLTLGGLPLVWRLAQPVKPAVYGGAAGAFAFMVVMQLGLGEGGRGGEASAIFLLLSGLAGASAMILPGVSGGYLLLILGQYENILGAVDTLKEGLLGGFDMGLIMESMTVVIPVGIGVVVGIVGVSNLLKWLLSRYEKATLGALLGLLLGAVVGLWPFQQPVEPELGSVVKAQVVTVENRSEIDPEDWPLQRFTPTGGQMGASVGLALLGFGVTLLVARLGGTSDDGDGDGEGGDEQSQPATG